MLRIPEKSSYQITMNDLKRILFGQSMAVRHFLLYLSSADIKDILSAPIVIKILFYKSDLYQPLDNFLPKNECSYSYCDQHNIVRFITIGVDGSNLLQHLSKCKLPACTKQHVLRFLSKNDKRKTLTKK